MKCSKCGQLEGLHFERCPNHDISNCLACKELLEEENYEELARVRGVIKSGG